MNRTMKKLTLLLSLILGTTLVPMYALAETRATSSSDVVITTSSSASEAQIFTACSQSSIEVRDSSIGSARTAYNNAMTVALDARKEAEKRAVALVDAGDKKDAIKVAVDEYKKAVTQAQDNLTRARKEAWSTFESNMKACRDMREGKEASANEATPQTTTLKADSKTTQSQPESKSFLDTLWKFFKKGE